MLKTIVKVAAHSFSRWREDIRVPIVFLLLFFYIWISLDPVRAAAQSIGHAINPLLFPFLLGTEVNQLIFAMGILFLFSDAPFMDSTQLFVVQRTKRLPWVIGQILYVFLATAVYVLAICTFSLIIVAPIATFSTDGWGTAVSTLAYTDIGRDFLVTVPFSTSIVEAFLPFEAFFLQMALEYGSLLVIGLGLFVLGVSVSNKAGLLFGGVVCLFDLLAINTFPTLLLWVSPTTLSRMNMLDLGGYGTGYPTIIWSLGFLISVIAVLVVAGVLVSKKLKIDVRPDL